MNIDITLTRESDGRLKATARTNADEYGSQLEVAIWSDVGANDPARIANLVGRAVQQAGLNTPSAPASESTLNLAPVYEPETSVQRRVVTGGDTEALRALINGAILAEENLYIDYTDANENRTRRTVRPTSLEWGIHGRWVKAVDSGVPKQFYLSRIDSAEVVPS